MKKLRGFTLSEILIALLVLGIIVAASVPVILNLTPNKNAIMIKKAYYATESIIHGLINDENYYPDMTANCLNANGTLKTSGTDNCYYGFDYAPSAIYVPGVTNQVTTGRKLQCLFASKLNIKEDLAEVCKTSGTDIVTTMDGMTWNLAGLSNGATAGTLQIDVDGLNKGVNSYALTGNKGKCDSDGSWGITNCNTDAKARDLKKFDRIEISIDKEGKLSIDEKQDAFIKIISGETKLIGGDDD